MSKKVGALGLVLTAGLLFVHPSTGEAQERYGSEYYYHNDPSARDQDYGRYERQSFREERQARNWRETEMREREKWERRNHRGFHNGYRDQRYPGYRYGDPYSLLNNEKPGRQNVLPFRATNKLLGNATY